MGRDAVTESLAYLGLGTNLGDRWDNLYRARKLISSGSSVRHLRSSRVYETEPWGITDQPRYLNCVLEVATTLDPEALLTRCKDVEQELGRMPGPRWGPRLIDLDILLMDTGVVELPHLQIPHPRLHLRAFALVPLAELVPSLAHPMLGRTIRDLADNAEGHDGVQEAGNLD